MLYEQKYGVEVVGITPTLMHWDNIEWADQLEEKRTWIKENDRKKFKAGDDRCPPDTWKGWTYNDGKTVCWPADNMRSCLMKAGAQLTLQGKKSYKSVSQSGIMFNEFFLAFLVNGKPMPWPPIQAIEGEFKDQAAKVKAMGFELFMKRVRIGQAKHVRVRPRFDDWKLKFTVTVIDEQITEKVVNDLFSLAGRRVGFSDWRPGSPQSPGQFGLFSAEVKQI